MTLTMSDGIKHINHPDEPGLLSVTGTANEIQRAICTHLPQVIITQGVHTALARCLRPTAHIIAVGAGINHPLIRYPVAGQTFVITWRVT